MLLKFYGPRMCRDRPDVGNIFMQCLHLLRPYFVPLPWRFLTQPELQQGSDRLNCNQKHVLMLHAIKINCIYINEQVASIISCNLRSDSAQHFPSLPPGELYFWRPENSSRRPENSSRRPEISSRWPEILCRLINMYQLKFWLVHLGDDVRDASCR